MRSFQKFTEDAPLYQDTLSRQLPALAIAGSQVLVTNFYTTSYQKSIRLHQRDMLTRRIFWGFCRNWFLLDPLHYLSAAFDFEFAEIFVIEKRLPDWALNDKKKIGGHQLPDSASRRLPELGESGIRLSNTNISAISKPKSERLET